MDILTVAAFIVYGYFMYRLGKSSAILATSGEYIKDALTKARIPVGVLEYIDGQYYLFEKDSTNFLCQAETIEEIPLTLWENKKISVAIVLFPEETSTQTFWCINGKLKTTQDA